MNDISDIQTSPKTSLFERIGGKTAIGDIVDIFYDNMLADYRVNRFFNSSGESEQKRALKKLVIALLGGSKHTGEELTAMLDDFFMAAFAREKQNKFLSGSEFSFFSYIIERDTPSTVYLCDAHSHLLQYMPDDMHYDVVMEHLAAALRQLNMDQALSNEVLRVAESARNSVLGK